MNVTDTSPQQQACPPWCTDCERDLEPEGSVLHCGAAEVVHGYNAGTRVRLTVRPACFHLAPGYENGGDPDPDLDRPLIEVYIGRIRRYDEPAISLTPTQAEALAAALVEGAATIRAGESVHSHPRADALGSQPKG